MTQVNYKITQKKKEFHYNSIYNSFDPYFHSFEINIHKCQVTFTFATFFGNKSLIDLKNLKLNKTKTNNWKSKKTLSVVDFAFVYRWKIFFIHYCKLHNSITFHTGYSRNADTASFVTLLSKKFRKFKNNLSNEKELQ